MPEQKHNVSKKSEAEQSVSRDTEIEMGAKAPETASRDAGPVPNTQVGMGATADSGKITDSTVIQQNPTEAGESLSNYIGTGGIDGDPEPTLHWPADPGSAIGTDPLSKPDTGKGAGEPASANEQLASAAGFTESTNGETTGARSPAAQEDRRGRAETE